MYDVSGTQAWLAHSAEKQPSPLRAVRRIRTLHNMAMLHGGEYINWALKDEQEFLSRRPRVTVSHRFTVLGAFRCLLGPGYFSFLTGTISLHWAIVQ